MQGTGSEKKAANSVDQTRRQALQRLAVGAAFVAPLVTSVSVQAATISKVYGGHASSSGYKKDDRKNFGGNGR
jgi:hypothetical protein